MPEKSFLWYCWVLPYCLRMPTFCPSIQILLILQSLFSKLSSWRMNFWPCTLTNEMFCLLSNWIENSPDLRFSCLVVSVTVPTQGKMFDLFIGKFSEELNGLEFFVCPPHLVTPVILLSALEFQKSVQHSHSGSQSPFFFPTGKLETLF